MSDVIDKKWAAIHAAAMKLELRRDTVRKWRERSRVPYRWRIALIAKSRQLKMADFMEDD